MAQQATTATANGPIYGGANNGTLTGLGTADQRRALYLKLFSGEMFKGFQHNTISRDLVTRRTLTNGRSLQFIYTCLLYTSPSPRDLSTSRMPSSA